jgi:hypothetical protein
MTGTVARVGAPGRPARVRPPRCPVAPYGADVARHEAFPARRCPFAVPFLSQTREYPQHRQYPQCVGGAPIP